MSTRITQGSLIIPKENLEIHSKKATEDGKIKSSKAAAKKGGAALGKATEDGKIKSSKAAAKKGGAALGSRKALNDITNKSFLHQETSRKKELPEEDVNVAEEGFLHDHKKCIEAQQISMHALDLNLVLPGHDEFISKSTNPLPEPEKMDLTSLHCYPDLEELLTLESNWWSKTSAKQISPPSSPLYWESTSLYTSVFEFEDVEFELRPESEV